MDVDEAIRTQRSVRTFTDAPISDEDLRAILNAGRRAQSSRNSQPWTFVVVRDRETLRALAECGRYSDHLASAALVVALVAPKPADFDLGQAAAMLQLAAHARGIGSCIGSMWEQDRAKAILGIPRDHRFEQAISFGWPAGDDVDRPPKRGGRRSLDEVVRRERWDGEPGLGTGTETA
jgi:nitroreductase